MRIIINILYKTDIKNKVDDPIVKIQKNLLKQDFIFDISFFLSSLSILNSCSSKLVLFNTLDKRFSI